MRGLMVLAMASLAGLLLLACAAPQAGPLAVGDSAPLFTLPEAIGQEVSLDTLIGKRPVLLYFHMGFG